MSTERFDTSDIIGSAPASNATERLPSSIISSSHSAGANSAGKDITLNGTIYTIIKMIASSGEAEVFLVSNNSQQLVLKLYFSNFKPKNEVVQKLQKLKRSDLIYPLDQGYHQDRFWELNEYLPGGTLAQEMPVRDIKRIREIVQKINLALKACHQNNIIHRDIKPVNVFFRDHAKTDMVLGDFGIASSIVDGTDYTITSTARTTTYAAPELFSNINNQTTLDYKVDYYALGISLLELWKGGDPFKDVTQFKIMRMKTEGQVPIPNDMFDEVENLIKGLITTEPPKRWGFEEVEKWLKGEPVKNFYQRKEIQFEPYEFDAMQGLFANDPKELAYYMEKNMVKAERQLYSGAILNWIKSGSEDLYSEIHDIVNVSYPRGNPDSVLAGITKTIYLFDKDRPFKSFNGETFYSAADLGAHIEGHEDHFLKALTSPSAGVYLFLEARGLQDRADTYRKYFKQFTPIQAFRLVVLDLQENKLLFKGHLLENISQISNPPSAIQQDLLQAIADENSKVSVWLNINSPKHKPNLDIWRKLKQFTPETLKYALGTGGLNVNGKEVFSVDEFVNNLQDSIDYFTSDPQAVAHRERADYWLSNYQQSALPPILLNFALSNPLTFEKLKEIYEYLLSRHKGKDPLLLTKQLASVIAKVASTDQQKNAIAQITSQYYQQYFKDEKQYHVFALHLFEESGKVLKDLGNSHKELASTILKLIDPVIGQGIASDLVNVQNNSNTFNEYVQHLKTFFDEVYAPLAPAASSYTRWQKQQELIQLKFQALDNKLEKQKEKEVHVVEDRFEKYLKSSLETNIDFLRKGKSFFVIFMLLIGTVITFVYMQTVFMSVSFSFLGLGIGILMILIFRWIIRGVWRRSPDRGLGAVMDPIHRFVGRLVYRPIYKIMKNDPNSNLNIQVHQTKKNEIEKLLLRSEGQKTQEHFAEAVRIMLMNDQSISMELSKK